MESERSVLVKRIEQLDKAMKRLQTESIKMDQCNVLETRISKMESSRVHKEDGQLQLADRFDALREGLSSHLLHVIEVLKTDIHKQVDSSIQSYAANLEHTLSEALLSERHLINSNITERIEEVSKSLDKRLKQETISLREECLKNARDMLGSIPGRTENISSVINEATGSTFENIVVDDLRASITEPEELKPIEPPLEMKQEDDVVEHKRPPLSESASDDECSVHDPDALLAELGNDWDHDSDT